MSSAPTFQERVRKQWTLDSLSPKQWTIVLLFSIGVAGLATVKIMTSHPSEVSEVEKEDRNADFQFGFTQGYMVGSKDAIAKAGKLTWEQRERAADSLSSKPDFVKGWRAGYDTGYTDNEREKP